MRSPACPSNIGPGPKNDGGDERQERAHGLNPEAGEEIAAHKPGPTGGHTATWARDAGDLLKRTGAETELGMGSQAVGIGGDPCGGNESGQTEQTNAGGE